MPSEDTTIRFSTTSDNAGLDDEVGFENVLNTVCRVIDTNNQQLIAKNLSTSDRPQYRIHLEDIQKLDTSSPEPNKPRRRRSQQKDYFPDM